MKPIKTLALVAFAIVICLANLGAVEIVTEDFESGALPNGWTQEYVTNTYDWSVGTGSPTGFPDAANGGTNNAVMHNANPGVTKLVMPAMDLSAYEGGMVTLEFSRAQFAKGDEADNLKIYTKDASDGAWVLQKEYADATEAWTKETIRLKGVTDTYQVAFEVDFSNKNGVLLDDIKLTAETPIKDTVRVGDTEDADYATLGALFADIKKRDIEGDVTVFITSDITETVPISLNEFDNGSLTFKAFGAGRTISGAVDNNALITLLGADNVTFSGSLVTENPDFPAAEGEEEVPEFLEVNDANYLTFDNTSAANGTTILLTDVDGNGSQNVVFTNVNIDGATDGTSSDVSNGVAVWGADLSGTAGSSGHSNLVFVNSKFTSAATALKIEAGADDEMITNIILSNNKFTDAVNTYANAAISTKYTDQLTITSNTFSNFGTYAISVVENNNTTDTEAAKANIASNTFSNGSDNVDNVVYVKDSPKTQLAGNTFTSLTAERAINVDAAAGLQVMGNTITGGTYEEVIYADGVEGAKVNSNTIQNLVAKQSIYILEANDSEFISNTITNQTMVGSDYSNVIAGIFVENGANMSFSSNFISNLTLNSEYGQYSDDFAHGIHIEGTADGASFIGNAINNLAAHKEETNADKWVYVSGIYFDGSADKVVIQHNTISLAGTFRDKNSSSASDYSACIEVGDDSNNWDVQNNIFSNSYFGVGGDAPAYILYAGSNSLTATALNHNAYDIEDASIAGAAIAKIGGNKVYTLADWQTLTSMEADGTANKVYFVDGLHLDQNSINDMALRAPKIKGIDTDIDNEERPDGSNTYIGADVVNVTVALGDDLYINGGETVYCEDQNVSMTYSLSGTFADGIERTITNGITVKWEHNGDIIDDQDTEDSFLVSQNGMRLTVEPINAEHAGTYRAMFQYQGAEEISTQEVSIDVKQPVRITQNLQNVITGCANKDVLTFGIQAEHALEYVWQKYDAEAGEYVDITLEKEETFSNEFTIDLNTVAHTDAEGMYRVKAIGDELCATHHPVTLTSEPIEVVVYDQIKGVKTTAEFATENLCQGQTLKFSASIEEGDLIGYKWQKNVVGNWVDIDAKENPTAETAELVIENISFNDNGRYRCVAIGYNECQTLTNSDNDIEISVPDAFAITQNPEAQVVCKDGDASFMVAGNSVGEVISYQWMKDGMPISVEKNEFADDAILYINGADYINIGEYTCVITAEDCNGVNEFTSEPAILYVLRETEITRQPTSVTTNLGEDVTFTVEAHMKGIVPPYYQHDFQWYKAGVALEDNGRIQGAKSSVLTINEVDATDYASYYCVVTGQCGVATSKTASITEDYTIEIAAQPQTAAACEGAQTQFTVDANPSDQSMTIEYAWYFNGTKLADNVDYQGTTTETLTLSAAAYALEGKYSVKCTSNFGGKLYEVMSDEAELDVQNAPEVVKTILIDINVEEESELIIDAFDVNSESNVTYQWLKDDVEITGETDAIYKKAKAELTDRGSYTCKVTNSCGETVSEGIRVNIIKKTGSSVVENALAGLRIQNVTPNPVQNVATVTVENNIASEVKVYITDASGRVIATLFEGMLEGTKDITIDADASNLTSGAYMITMEANGTALTQSFVVVK